MIPHILVTGGGGYIGSHLVRALLKKQYRVSIIDNLSQGKEKFLPAAHVDFFKIDLRNFVETNNILAQIQPDAVIHLAASTVVSLSMKEPGQFMENNVIASFHLLEAMRLNKIKKIVFSSTAAVYGDPQTQYIREDSPLNPTNFYGQTKMMVEDLLRFYDQNFESSSIILRYFNAAGADVSDPHQLLGEEHEPESHLIPNVYNAILRENTVFHLFGNDYPTPDGTCLRDYIHVKDLADAHILALEYLLQGGKSDVFNLGTGQPASVYEIIAMAEKITQKKISLQVQPRRDGDPPVLVADSTKANKILVWNPVVSSLETIMQDAWQWHSQNKKSF